MGEVERREWHYPDSRTSIEEAERLLPANIVDANTKTYRHIVEEVVGDTETIESEQTLLYVAPFVDESLLQLRHKMLEQQERAISHVYHVANVWRSRIRI